MTRKLNDNEQKIYDELSKPENVYLVKFNNREYNLFNDEAFLRGMVYAIYHSNTYKRIKYSREFIDIVYQRYPITLKDIFFQNAMRRFTFRKEFEVWENGCKIDGLFKAIKESINNDWFERVTPKVMKKTRKPYKTNGKSM